MMTRRILALLLLCCLSIPLAADEPVVFRTEPDGAEAAVIIEFYEPPLLARPHLREAAKAGEAVQALDSLFARLEQDLAAIGGSVAAQSDGGVLRRRYRLTFAGASARVARRDVRAIRALPYVKAVHVDQRMEAHTDRSVPLIGAPKVWEELGARGRGIVVAVIDTGIDYRHASLGKGFGPGFKVAGGWDFANDDADPLDDNGHGTHVAGIVAGNVAPVVGVAPDATLLAYKVLDDEGAGNESDIIAAVERTLDPDGNGDLSDRADVANVSLGGPGTPDGPLVQAVERAIAAGVVFSISAGNAGSNGSIRSPGLAPSAITVGATDLDDHPPRFSSRGPLGGTWLLKPEVAAPGDSIRSARRGGGTLTASGTSMAAPHIAGVAALVRELHPGWTPQEVKSAIVSTAKAVTEANGSPAVLGTGTGRVEARRAVAATVLPSPAGLSFGIVTKRGERFSAARTLRLTNHGSVTETLALRAPNVPGGTKITIVPAEVTLAPGASAEVTVTLDVDKATPEPSENNVALTGSLELTGTSALRVPWIAVNGDVLSVTYEGGSDDFNIAVFPSARQALLWQEGPRTFGAFAFWRADIAIFDPETPQGPVMLVREQQPLDGHTRITLTPADAVHTLTMAGVDERGVPLAELAADPRNTSEITQHFMLPSTGRIILQLGAGKRSYRITPLSQTPIRSYEALFTPGARYFSMWVQNTIRKDESIAVSTSDWAGQTFENVCQTDCSVLFGAGIGSPLGIGWRFFQLPRGQATWKLFLTRPILTGPDLEEYAFRSHVFVAETDVPQDDPNVPNRWTYSSAAIYNAGGRITVAPFNRIIPLADYYAPSADEPVRLDDDGPVVLRTILNDTQFFIEPFGPLGSLFGDSILDVKASRYDAEGKPAGLAPFLNAHSYRIPSGEPEGVYRIDLTAQYGVAGMAGRLAQTSLYDTRVYKADNVGPPSLSMLHTETPRGVASTTLPAGSQSRLVFAARESTYYPRANIYTRHRLIDSSATRVWWRRHGTLDWQPLEVTVAGTENEFNFDSPGSPGTLFHGNLRDATAMEGAIDLKIHLASDHGATTDLVYEPAFLVGPAGEGRRRAVRH